MKFCTECDNMYYITINNENHDKLSYYCKMCKHIDNAIVTNKSVCIIRNNLPNTIMHIDNYVNQYTKLDPTLPRIYNLPCPNPLCISTQNAYLRKEREVLYMRYDDINMKYLYMCCHCDHIWLP
jgi:DNA-directed RNA polymerase subunit M/transcription elongation factor TFIIS